MNRRLIVLDWLAAAGYLAVAGAGAVAGSDHPAWLAGPVMLAVGLPLGVRRNRPFPVFLLVLAASIVALAIGLLADPFLAAAFALYPVATAARRDWFPMPVAATIAVAVLAGSAVAGSPQGGWGAFGVAALGAGFLAGSWTAGRMTRAKRLESARSTAEATARAVVEERLRIAREMHDVVAHGMSLIAVQAGTANHVLDTHPGEAREALRVIESASRSSLAEMRRLLGVLRDDGQTAELTPAPGLAGLTALADKAGSAGVPVDLDVQGVDDLPDGVALSVYRIVQESLTNVVRHAAPTRCRVTVAGSAGEVRVAVVDDGPPGRPAPPQRPGHGLIGMRERVLRYGGTFRAGPRERGGFEVSACLPR